MKKQEREQLEAEARRTKDPQIKKKLETCLRKMVIVCDCTALIVCDYATLRGSRLQMITQLRYVLVVVQIMAMRIDILL